MVNEQGTSTLWKGEGTFQLLPEGGRCSQESRQDRFPGVGTARAKALGPRACGSLVELKEEAFARNREKLSLTGAWCVGRGGARAGERTEPVGRKWGEVGKACKPERDCQGKPPEGFGSVVSVCVKGGTEWGVRVLQRNGVNRMCICREKD